MTHPNEILMTPETRDQWLATATALGPAYLAAVREQLVRQGLTIPGMTV